MIVRPCSSRAPIVSRKCSADMGDVRRGERRPVGARDATFPIVEIDGHPVGDRHRAHAGRLPETVDGRPDRPAVALPGRRGDARASQTVERESVIRRPHAIDHHAARHQKRHRDADLHHRGDAMGANPLGAAAPRVLLQRRQQAGAAEANGWQQSEEHTDHQAEARRYQGARCIEVDLRLEPARPSTIRSAQECRTPRPR